MNGSNPTWIFVLVRCLQGKRTAAPLAIRQETPGNTLMAYSSGIYTARELAINNTAQAVGNLTCTVQRLSAV